MRCLAPLMAIVVAAIGFECVAATADESRPILVARSPWMKFCLKNGKTGFKTTCVTGNEVRSEADHSFLATVAIIEPEDGKKTLRVTFPLGMQVAHGTRLIIDREDPQRSPYVICFTSGCMSDYDASSAMIDIMKRGQVLLVQAIDTAGAPLTVQLPLTDFAAAYDGPPSDPGRVETLRRKPKPWLDDTLQPSLRPRAN
jgi:invasion protein IalB